MRVLTLSSNYEPIGTISWKKAVSMFCMNKVVVLAEYDEEVRSPSTKMKIPSVIALKHGKSKKINSVRFSRNNLWLRDEAKCQYCGTNSNINDFTIDHVNPRCNGGKTTWENVVVSCYKCNQKKGEKTLKECGYKLIKVPKKPITLPYITELGGFYSENGLHPSWKFWLGK